MTQRPFGSWPSPLHADRVARSARRLSQPQLSRGRVFWLEGRADEAGRQVVVGASVGGDGGTVDLTPAYVNVRTVVHEYGGGDYLAAGDAVFHVDIAREGVFRTDEAGTRAVGGTLPRARYADFALSPDGRWLVAVEEEHGAEGQEPANRIVALALEGSERRVVAAGHDFVSTPRFSPDGRRFCYLSWEHPNLPWDGTALHVVGFGAGGPEGSARTVAGGPRESIFQPGFSPAGVLTFVSDRSGFWNLYQERANGIVALHPRAAEFGLPQWVFGMSTYAFIDADTLLCVYHEAGADHLARLDLQSGELRAMALPFSDITGLAVEDGHAAFLGAGATRAASVCTLDLESGAHRAHRAAFSEALDPALIAAPELVQFASANGRSAYAYLYRPTHPGLEGPPGERPPLIVKSHGGPTAATSGALRLGIQYWTSRGFAVLDVDYGGSTGYGRAYRALLEGRWGEVDVEDCCAAATWAAGEGLADVARLAITGGSAGGYTTLAALCFTDTFAVGASHYGIGDLEALARDTHKFESRYLDGLIGPYPEARERYRARSPIHHLEGFTCPVIFFQGLEDKVVPPAQAEEMVAALAARGVLHAYVPFEGEQHGFRRAENIQTALEGELYFYGQILGFEVDVAPGAVRIVRP